MSLILGDAHTKSCRWLTFRRQSSTTTRITYNQPHIRFYQTEETNSKRTSTQHASYYSGSWRIRNQLAALFCRRVIETKSGQTLVFNPGSSTGHLRACLFLGTWQALVCGEIFVRALDEAAALFGGWLTRIHCLAGEVQANRLRRTYCGRSLFLRRQAGLKMSCRQRRYEAISAMGMDRCQGTP